MASTDLLLFVFFIPLLSEPSGTYLILFQLFFFLVYEWNSPRNPQRQVLGQAHALIILVPSVALWTAYAFPLMHPNLLLDWLQLLLSTLCWGCL